MTLRQFIEKSKTATGHHFINYHASEFSCNKFSHNIANDTKNLFTMTYNETTSSRPVYNDYTKPYTYNKIPSKSLTDYDKMIHDFTDQEDNVFKSKKILNNYPFTVTIVNFLIKLLRFKKMLKYLK